MRSSPIGTRFTGVALAVLLLAAMSAFGQSTATLAGTVTDQSGAIVPNARVAATNQDTNLRRATSTDATGNYRIPFLPAGRYRVSVEATGLQHQVITDVILDVSRTVAQNFSLKPATVEQAVTITGEAPVVESSTMTVGQVVNNRTVQEIPLNGRHFVDLSSLVAGTVVPPANGFLTAPLRGQGSFGVNTAGTRENMTNFMINGVNLNDMANGQITFQPSINTVSEFKMDNSTYSAEYGRNAGSIVNIATRSGTNSWHGEAFEFLRNEDLDARNFFNKETQPKNPFKRNQFGGALGGPIWKNHTFFFASYEGLRQRQGLALAASVPSAAQRATVTNPTVQKLLTLLPDVPGGDATHSVSFSGSAVAPVNIDQWTGDISHTFSDRDHLHGYYVFQRDLRKEPMNASATVGNNVPGSGDTRQSRRQIFTLNESHVFSPKVVNDFRLGFNRIHITFQGDNTLNPADLGILDGLNAPVGIPQIRVTSLGLRFGGFGNFPQGRGDYTAVASDTVSYQRGRHSLKFGGEYRRFNGNSFAFDDGTLTFSDTTHFLAGQATAFNITIGNRAARVYEQALGAFAQDNFKLTPSLTLELGLRWEWNFSPTEAMNRSTFFNPATDTLVPLGTNGRDEIYHQNNRLFQPRVGFAWDMFHDGKILLRGGYGYLVDQPEPITTVANPPYSNPVSYSSSAAKPFTTFSNLLTDAAAGGLNLLSVNPNYNDAYIQTWNLNVQTQITPSMGLMIGYFGNKGTHLNMQLNQNQFIQTAPGVLVRPFPKLSASSPVSPTAPLSNIRSNESVGNSSYNALWVTMTKRLSSGLQFNANYTWSKALDYNSQDFQNFVVQDSLNPRADRAPSDFDARHHFTFSGIYQLPFHGNRFKEGWRLGGTVILQSGNPLTIFAGDPATGVGGNSLTGVSGTLRPDIVGPLPVVGKTLLTSGSNAGTVQWFTPTTVCDPRSAACPASAVFALPVTSVGGVNVYHFGNAGRNILTGPDFRNVDLSISKTTRITERLSHELRVESFDLFNHPNFGNPGLVAQVGSANFGIIRATRAPTGDAGSSRQIQFAMKLIF
jgi:carboxypeptidase family protein